jgi:phosphatidylinositol glycan class M
MCVPNVWFRPFGKLLFCAVDLVIGWLTYRILRMRGLGERSACVHTSLFLLSPVVINVSTRGNADSIVCAFAVAAVYFLMVKRVRLAAVSFGLAVHLKIYPIVYALPLVLFLDEGYVPLDFPLILGAEKRAAGGAGGEGRAGGGGSAGGGDDAEDGPAGLLSGLVQRASSAASWVRRFLTWRRIEFGLLSGGVFVALTGACYALYGWTFLYESYLYHFVRTDNRHNFSPYFYDLYLRYDRPSRAGAGLLSFLPQFGTVFFLGGLYYRDLPFCLFLQTLAFVAFNKVVTAQYFHWYFCLIPLITSQSGLSGRRALAAIALWAATELSWNYFAWFLEHQGQSNFLLVWGAGLVFFAANIYLLAQLISHHTYRPVFEGGRLVLLDDVAEEGVEDAGRAKEWAAAETGRKQKRGPSDGAAAASGAGSGSAADGGADMDGDADEDGSRGQSGKDAAREADGVGPAAARSAATPGGKRARAGSATPSARAR